MRKIAAILLIVILLFNWGGYRLFSDFLQHKADLHLETKLDKNDYNDDELIEIKVPLQLPYQLNWKSFERFDGEIDVDGKHYKYVKRKIYNDSLVLLCLPNKDKQNLEKAKHDYFKVVNDLDGSSQKKSEGGTASLKNFFGEYFVEQPVWLHLVTVNSSISYYDKKTAFLPMHLIDAPFQPPKTWA